VRAAILLELILLLTAGAHAEQPDPGAIRWISDFRFYADNTEFSGPYREGETILGAQVSSVFEIPIGDKVSLLAGGFADFRTGDEDHPTDALPILSFRYVTGDTRFIFGTLETVRRHGLIDPLQVSTLELTRPVETGVQLLSGGERWSLDAFLNWQKLNTPEHREAFDYGLVGSLSLGAGLALEVQAHGYHEGGQLHAVGEVYNNVAFAGGASWEREFPVTGTAGAAAMFVWSRTSDVVANGNRPTDGEALWVQLFVRPWTGGEIQAVLWTAEDFFSLEGDPNYGSRGADPGLWITDRDYKELGVTHAFPMPNDTSLTAEARVHWIDDFSPEVSFRLYARVPVRFHVK
jgi:hypothetical protein